MSHSGKVQCTVTPVILKRLGFEFWDLGMGMEYKANLGAVNVPRLEFLDMLESAREKSCNLILERCSCKEVLSTYKAAVREAADKPEDDSFVVELPAVSS